jgi:hypothetical protein
MENQNVIQTATVSKFVYLMIKQNLITHRILRGISF